MDVSVDYDRTNVVASARLPPRGIGRARRRFVIEIVLSTLCQFSRFLMLALDSFYLQFGSLTLLRMFVLQALVLLNHVRQLFR